MRRLAVLVSLALAAPLAAEPFLVADLNSGPNTEPQQVVLPSVGGEIAYFIPLPWRPPGVDVDQQNASSPGPFSLVGSSLLTGADDGEHGRELWAIPVSDVIDP